MIIKGRYKSHTFAERFNVKKWHQVGFLKLLRRSFLWECVSLNVALRHLRSLEENVGLGVFLRVHVRFHGKNEFPPLCLVSLHPSLSDGVAVLFYPVADVGVVLF